MLPVTSIAAIFLVTVVVATPTLAQDPPNVLIVLGIEHLDFYGVGDGPFADTPNLADWSQS